MFELSWNPYGSQMSSRPQANMPVDFAAYLLAASPPGFGFYTGPSPLYQGFNESKKQCDSEDSVETIKTEEVNRVCGFSLVTDDNNEPEMDGLTRNFLEYCQVRDRPGTLDLLEEAEREDEIGSCGSSFISSSSGNTTPRSRPESPRSPASPGGKGLKKRVSFADDLGLALENIRIMTEPSNTPPRLRPDIFQHLRNGAQAGVTEVPPLVLNFPQPASDYVEFRRRIEHDCICLENVIIRDYNLMGTIKVKNIAFEKSVRVRCTFNGWQTHEDIPTVFVPNSSSVFDTFSFTLNVSKSLSPKDKMEFCVCYSACNQQFWDNNKGLNYVVVTSDWNGSSNPQKEDKFREDNAIFSPIKPCEEWSQYSSWARRDSSVPYY